MTVIGEMQQLLARLYDAPVEHDVQDFLVTSRQDLPAQSGAGVQTDEQLVLVEPEAGAEGPLRIALYIDATVLERLAEQSPFASLESANLADYCTALEGVSHFHYVAWCCARGRPVSLLELEMQAEVDKYVGAVQLLASQTDGRFPRTLHRELFERVSYAAGLDRASLERYELANRHAAKFCRYLDEKFLRQRRVRVEAWLAALRRFYRSSHSEKMRQVGFA
jgi:hypothetical protein